MVLNKTPSIDLGYATVTMREDGIVNTDILMNDSATLKQAKELLAAYLEVPKGLILLIFLLLPN
jgi:hypothetical protein